jgi:hypothetical protein
VTLLFLAKHRRENDEVELVRVQLFVEVLGRGDQGLIAARREQRLASRKEGHINLNGQNSISDDVGRY